MSDYLPLDEADHKALNDINKRGTLSKIFAVAAVPAFAAMAAGVAAVYNYDVVTQAVHVGVFGIMASVLTGLHFSRFHEETRQRFLSLLARQEDKFSAARAEKVARESGSFLARINDRALHGEELKDADYAVLAQCSPTIQQAADPRISLSRTMQAAKAGTNALQDFMAARDYSYIQRNVGKDYTNTLWSLPAMLTYTIPVLMLLTAFKQKKVGEADIQRKAPETPDLYKIVAEHKPA